MARDNGEHILKTLMADLEDYQNALGHLKAIHERAPLAHEADGLMELMVSLTGSMTRCEMTIVQTRFVNSWDINSIPKPGANASTNGGLRCLNWR